jgi:hypothetical protein
MSAQTEAVAAEVARCGSLDNAITQLAHDACVAPWGAPVHDIYRAALAERSAAEEAANPALRARRLTREEALRARAYHEAVLASPCAAEERVSGSHEMIRQIDAALASVWPVPAVASIRTIHSGE